MEADLYSVEMVAAGVKRSHSTVLNAIRAGVLPSIRREGRRFVRAADVDAWIAGGLKTTRVKSFKTAFGTTAKPKKASAD